MCSNDVTAILIWRFRRTFARRLRRRLRPPPSLSAPPAPCLPPSSSLHPPRAPWGATQRPGARAGGLQAMLPRHSRESCTSPHMLSARRPAGAGGQEILQTKADRAKLDGACTSASSRLLLNLVSIVLGVPRSSSAAPRQQVYRSLIPW